MHTTLDDHIRQFEQQCHADTQAFLAGAPADLKCAVNTFDDLFQRLYRLSCCFWGCHGKEHVFEYLSGRCVSSLTAGRRLAETGYYDESLSLVRSIGEVANLLNLFWRDNGEIRKWLDFPDRERRNRFSPVAVRRRLEELQWLIPFDDEHYKRLCELAVHPTPQTRPNAHQDVHRPVLGAYFQPNGFVFVTWELCWALAAVSGPIAKLAIFPETEARQMAEATVKLFELALTHISGSQDGDG